MPAQWLHKISNQTGLWKIETDVTLLPTDMTVFKAPAAMFSLYVTGYMRVIATQKYETHTG